MAGRGPAPKPENERQRRHATLPMQDLTGEPVPAPKLPNRKDYRSETLRWWDMWAKSPQGSQFIASDWHRLLMLAPIVDDYWRDPKVALLAEIRQNEERLGATVMDRQRLRWKVTPPTAEEAKQTGSRPDPRLRVVGDDD